MTLCVEDIIGSEPINVKWNVVRGDTASLRIDFLQEDEVTAHDISGWSLVASAYDPKTTFIDELDITVNEGWIVVTAPAEGFSCSTRILLPQRGVAMNDCKP